MLIRKLTIHDAAALKAIRLEAVQNSPRSFWPNAEEIRARELDSFCQQLSDPYETIYGVFLESNLIAIAGLKRYGLAKLQHKATIFGVYTQAMQRKQGIARRLLLILLDDVYSDPNIVQISLSVNIENQSAKALYISLGFEPYALEKNSMRVDGVFIHEEHLVLALPIRG
ncbi:GNAT family N-acetyltransferase [Iodobacter sp. CM08]|uniref:GNAT family N-acetyltransferase n=1 Tax=Iodobacter sp. CM08 TaxID=3085902 RepID=UPI002982834C|nr:GNAT family N-acetyltransferase [Iodobacter sp. CM08]MDW5415770.1 GNAT family N-acetyltransferase [Iodobacter sp. CM08]